MKLTIGLLLASLAWGGGGEVFVSSEKAKTYHKELECSGLKRAQKPRVGEEQKAKEKGLRQCGRCWKEKGEGEWTKEVKK